MSDNDLISRSLLLRQIRPEEPDDHRSAVLISDAKRIIQEFVEKAPAVDAVPVVRCKDCAKRGNNECPMFFYLGYGYADFTSHNGYCDRGERRSDP